MSRWAALATAFALTFASPALGAEQRRTRQADPVLCPILAAAAGRYGPVTIRPNGTVTFTDGDVIYLIYICPPYDS